MKVAEEQHEPFMPLCPSSCEVVPSCYIQGQYELRLYDLFSHLSEVLQQHGVEPLIVMLNDTRETAAANAAIVLTNMSPEEGTRSEIQRLGVVEALIGPVSSQ